MPADETPEERLLKSHGVEITPIGLADYLRRLHPTAENRRSALSLIGKLSSSVYEQREAATRALIAMPTPPVPQLQAATKSTDPEVRWRARLVLERNRREGDAVLLAVLRTIAARKTPGAVDDLIETIPLLERRDVQIAAGEALRAAATIDDAPALKSALQHANPHVRDDAIRAYAGVLGDGAAKHLAPIAENAKEAEFVRLTAARELANLGDRRSLPVLVGLLDSEDVDVRSFAGLILRAGTGINHQFAAYDTAERRKASVAKWRTWLAKDAASAKLKFPLKFHVAGRSFLHGHTLMATGYKNKVIELDRSGKEIWNYDIKGAYGAEKLFNGNILIASYNSGGGSKVVEVEPRSKKIVWEYGLKSCLNARVLPSGNILIAGHTGKEVLEVSRDKRVVWKRTTTGNCYDAHRLRNGNTLIATNTAVVEITPEGRDVWDYKPGGSVYGIHPLPNGNVLVAVLSGKVVEVTRDKRIVWEHASRAFDVYRLPNGNTLITHNTGAIEVTRVGKTVWSKTGFSYGRVRK